jgi:hypothetical protein
VVIYILLVKRRVYLSVSKSQGQVHEIDSGGSSREGPFHSMVVLNVSLKGLLFGVIVVRGDPDPEYVVDESLVVEDGVLAFIAAGVLMGGKEHGGPGWGGWVAHGGAVILVPGSVVEREVIISHHDREGIKYSDLRGTPVHCSSLVYLEGIWR